MRAGMRSDCAEWPREPCGATAPHTAASQLLMQQVTVWGQNRTHILPTSYARGVRGIGRRKGRKRKRNKERERKRDTERKRKPNEERKKEKEWNREKKKNREKKTKKNRERIKQREREKERKIYIWNSSSTRWLFLRGNWASVYSHVNVWLQE